MNLANLQASTVHHYWASIVEHPVFAASLPAVIPLPSQRRGRLADQIVRALKDATVHSPQLSWHVAQTALQSVAVEFAVAASTSGLCSADAGREWMALRSTIFDLWCADGPAGPDPELILKELVTAVGDLDVDSSESNAQARDMTVQLTQDLSHCRDSLRAIRHDIRSPLQGALLNIEMLMLDETANGLPEELLDLKESLLDAIQMIEQTRTV